MVIKLQINESQFQVHHRRLNCSGEKA